MRLSELLPTSALPPGLSSMDVASISADSRAIVPGALFFAVSGAKADGLAFAADAAKRGAVAIVAERAPATDLSVPVIPIADVRAALAQAAARLHPAQPAVIAAVTGTSGKTSVAAFLRQIWRACGRQAASIGTIGLVTPSGDTYGSLTTPDPVTLHKTLDKIARDGVTHLAMEASSHGLDQRRLDGVRLTAAGFTNLSRDHLDYHADLDDYLAAKLRLFSTLLPSGATAVIDADSDVAERVTDAAQAHGCAVMTVGVRGNGISLESATPGARETMLVVSHEAQRTTIRLPLAGAFQVSNALVAAGLAIATGEHPSDVFAALERLEGAPGRLEHVGDLNDAAIFVDYAHKPDALTNVLATLRPLARRKLVALFGCGGDRDRGKRPLMGAIAARDADIVYVTDDNPRSERPAAIRQEILAGMRDGAAKIIEIGDRRDAIETAVAALRAGDILVVAGKGHETGQIIGSEVLPFSDHDAVRAALADMKGGAR